ncbi:MAG: hypothetical protein ACE5D2_04185 [Fidelibacterota bacterium]
MFPKQIIITIFYVLSLSTYSLVAQSTGKTQGSVGAVTLDNKVWNQVALRPVIPFGKFGLALDLVIYFDEHGNIHRDEWDFSNSKAVKNTLIDKIYYLRYGFPGDPLYGKIGALDRVDLGYGILVSEYSNALLFPQVRKIGMDLEYNGKKFNAESFLNDFKENIGLFGIRVGTRKFFNLPMAVSVVGDRNQYLGLKDSDDDGRPDLVDDFPDSKKWWVDTDGDGLADNDPNEMDIDGDGITDTLDSRVPGWNGGTLVLDQDIIRKGEPLNLTSNRDPVYGLAFDVGLPLLAEKRLLISLYAEAAKLIGKTPNPDGSGSSNLGMGFVPLGVASRFGPAKFNFEYRIIPDGRFEFGYWDRAYEIERITVSADTSGDLQLISKESRLGRFGKQSGYFGRLSLNLGSAVVAIASYNNMVGELWSAESEKFTRRYNRNFRASLHLKKSLGRLNNARVFYQQRNVPNPFKFEFSESTVLGYQVGISMGSGLVLKYTFRRTFRDMNGDGIIRGAAEKIDITNIETSFNL